MPAPEHAPTGLALYMFTGCGHCRRVIRTIETLGLEIELRDILKVPEHREELRREGGRGTVPCLRIARADGTVEWLYDSNIIIRYLRARPLACARHR